MKTSYAWLIIVLGLFLGCASLSYTPNVPPEFKQKVILQVQGDYEMFQAPRSGYDVGDLQSFHTQHTFPIVVEDAFRDIFSQVEVDEGGADIKTKLTDIPAVFEVKLVDLSHDVYMEASDYRAEVVVAAAMKSPSGNIFWQQAFRGKGYAIADTTHSIRLGPQDAVIDAVRDVLAQMKEAIVNSPDVRLQLQHYLEIQRAREATETKI